MTPVNWAERVRYTTPTKLFTKRTCFKCFKITTVTFRRHSHSRCYSEDLGPGVTVLPFDWLLSAFPSSSPGVEACTNPSFPRFLQAPFRSDSACPHCDLILPLQLRPPRRRASEISGIPWSLPGPWEFLVGCTLQGFVCVGPEKPSNRHHHLFFLPNR